jgi:4-hydroxy-tetrahydrodipicolinate synthase
MLKLKGIIPAMLTPLDGDQKINEKATRKLVDHLIERGVHAIFALGTNGEFFSLNDSEKSEVMAIVIDQVKGRVPVMIGSGAAGTREAVTLSKEAEKAGADCLSVITPYFNALSQREIINHFRAVADAVSIPVLLYNIPARAGNEILPETAKELAKAENITGIKDSSGNFDTIKAYINNTEGMDFSVYAGTDSLILKTLEAGGMGAVAATANVCPELAVDIYEGWAAGDTEKARAAQERLSKLREISRLASIPAAYKAALELQGIEVGPPRLPAMPLDESLKEELSRMLSVK